MKTALLKNGVSNTNKTLKIAQTTFLEGKQHGKKKLWIKIAVESGEPQTVSPARRGEPQTVPLLTSATAGVTPTGIAVPAYCRADLPTYYSVVVVF